MPRLAIVTSHPIQYHAPLFRALAERVDLDVYYAHEQDAAGQGAAGFGVAFDWDVPLLGGYAHHFLPNVARHPGVSRFADCDTPAIGARLADGHYDACLITGWYLKSYLQALLACRRYGIPALARGDSQLATRQASLWGRLKYLPYRALLAQFSAHLYVGQANRAYLRHFGVPDARLFFTPHFVDNAFFDKRARASVATGDRARIRQDAGAAEDTTLFLFAGKLIPKKRPLDFVRAVAEAATRDPRVRGLVVGAGPLDTAVEDTIRSLRAPVSCAGFRNQTAMPAYLAAGDALVLPSDAGETWGLVVNEAMACGLPAIVSETSGSSQDLIVEGETGYRVPLGRTDVLAKAMLRLAGDLRSRPEAIHDAVARQIAGYSCAAAVEGVLTALTAVARQAPSRSREH